MRLVDYTTGQEFHLAPKMLFYRLIVALPVSLRNLPAYKSFKNDSQLKKLDANH